MSVSYDTILKKMMGELQQAQAHPNEEAEVRQHVRAARLLGDLILGEAGSVEAAQQVPNSQPLRSSVQNPTVFTPQSNSVPIAEPAAKEDKINHEEANGSSLFDF
ncbi:hypothetical protein N781_01180 [Pontibacillus halophilus JSM 076056 = DSM 19796]|uniref:Uncharacterized protein n=1 Tax=Pontibacillus halophilus JSM 076056 = DSM 19796 TaxID=1385510 RepID=A0A0A5GPC2_9BACI|nr:YwdI family protein [Pontibacillus halophilus]KGX93839.1 hypothetical protein N781_01180 [Pontibacillus halophilus JSM 076056 = DSM 19796]